MDIEYSTKLTGVEITTMTITGTSEYTVAQGSSLKVFIPKQFVITDFDRVKASCSVALVTDGFGTPEFIGFSD